MEGERVNMYEIATVRLGQVHARPAIWTYRVHGALVSCLRRGQEGGGLVAQQLIAVFASIPRNLNPEVRDNKAKLFKRLDLAALTTSKFSDAYGGVTLCERYSV